LNSQPKQNHVFLFHSHIRKDFGVDLSRRRIYFFLIQKRWLKGPLETLIEASLETMRKHFGNRSNIPWSEAYSSKNGRKTALFEA
jgi:hypothetical protein